MAVLSHNRNTQKENKSQESAKGQIQGGAGDTVSTIENHGRKRGNTKSVSIEQVSSVLIFFSLRKKGEKTKAGKGKTNSNLFMTKKAIVSQENRASCADI